METFIKLSFEEYFEKYYHQALRYTIKKVGTPNIAEDITMDAFVACFRKFDSFDPHKATFATWLYVVLNNRIKNYYRDHKDVDCLDDHCNLAVYQDNEMTQSIYLCELRNALADAIQTLSYVQRQIIIKKYFGHFSSNEIADTLNLTPINVRVQLTRALKKLKDYFEKNNMKWEI